MKSINVKTIFAFSAYLEDTCGISIVPSKFKGFYYVIEEFAEFEKSNTYFMNAEQILKKFNITIPKHTLEELIKNNSNDFDLGEAIRFIN